jgi:Protein kinase domain
MRHPGIVGLLTFDEIAGTRYFVMPYIEGESLERRLKNHGPLSEDEAAKIVAEVADALSYAHEKRVVHRDIKPANILLTDHAMVADFGIAKSSTASQMTETGAVLGTPRYMSPEQCAGKSNLDVRSDIYSLGIVAYELLAGSPPFTGTLYELLHKHRNEQPVPLTQRCPSVSPTYAATVARCLAKDPNERWQSAADIAHALRATDEDPDPSQLQPLRHVLAYGFLGSLAMATWGTVLVSGNAPDEMSVATMTVLWTVEIVTPLVWALAIFRRRLPKDTGSAGEAIRIGMRVPVWWSAWWPRRWLSPVDRSRELPRRVRIASQWCVAFVTALAVALSFAGIAMNVRDACTQEQWLRLQESSEWRILAAISYVVTPAAALIGLMGFFWTWWRARADIGWITSHRARRLFERLRSPAIWQEPWVRELIESGKLGQRPVPQTFAVLVQSAVDLYARIATSEHDINPEVLATLLQCRSTDAAWEREASELANDADSGEMSRLQARLSKLKELAAPRPDQVVERDLLGRQLSLHENRVARTREIKDKRQSLHGAVARLWRKLDVVFQLPPTDRGFALDDIRRISSEIGDLIEPRSRLTLKADAATVPVDDAVRKEAG